MKTVGTKVFAAGISEYAAESLRLRFAANNAIEIVEAFARAEGCAIPRQDLLLVTESGASRSGMINGLEGMAGRCSADDVLIVFFSGHGERIGDEFFLLPWDADPANLGETAVGAPDLRDALGQCAARGILVILDCCRGAGFAENADRFFVTLGGREFRLLLSASRADQPSFEFESQRATFFSRRLIEVLRGDVPIGEQPGVVYFLELSRYLSRKIAEDLETIGQPRNAQEPISVGTYAGDPRLFILRQVALDRLETETPRYSRRFLRRSLRRSLAVVAILSLLGLASYYYYLEHSYYVWVEPSTVEGFEGDYLAVYAGDERFNALGFPHLIYTTDIPVDALPRQARPGVGAVPKANSSRRLESQLFGQISPEWKGIVSAWKGNGKAALDYVQGTWEDDQLDNDSPALVKAVDAAARAAGRANAESYLDQILVGYAAKRDQASARLIAEWNPDLAANRVLQGGTLGRPEDNSEDSALMQRGFLEGLGPGCTSTVEKAMDDVAGFTFRRDVDYADYDHRAAAWFAALLRTRCPIAPARAAKAIEYASLQTPQHKFELLSLLASPTDSRLENWIVADYHKQVATLSKSPVDLNDKYNASVRIWVDLRLLGLAAPRSVPKTAWGLLNKAYLGQVRFASASALIAQQHDAWKSILQIAPGDPWVLSALAEAGIYDDAAARSAFMPPASESSKTLDQFYRSHHNIARFFLREIRRHKITEAIRVAQEIEQRYTEPEVKVEAAKTLDTLLPQKQEDKSGSKRKRYFVSNHHAPSHLQDVLDGEMYPDMYSWAVSADDDVFALFMQNFGTSPLDDAKLLGRLPLSDYALADLRSRLHEPSQRISACAVLAMRGTVKDLVILLSATDLHIRQTAESFAIYNPRIVTVLAAPEMSGFGLQTRFYLQRQRELQSTIYETVTKLPQALLAIGPNVLENGSPDPSRGLLLWAEDLSDSAGPNAVEPDLLLDEFH